MQLDVESILYGLGVEVIRESGDEVLGKCPMHLQRTGKEDRHPSWSINTKTYVHHCFSCGYAGTLSSLYQDIFGEVPEDLEWELSKQALTSALDKKEQKPEYSGPKVNEWVLQNYTDIPQKLLDRRNLRRESVDHFGIRWDTTNKTWVIPIRTPKGDLIGFQFRQKGVVINHPAGMEKSKTLFGIHLATGGDTVAIVESPLDAVRMYGAGIPAVASFGASISHDQVALLSRNFRFVVCAMDNDAAGHKAKELLHRLLPGKGCVVIDFDYSQLDVKDPGDVESDPELIRAWQRSMSFKMCDQ